MNIPIPNSIDKSHYPLWQPFLNYAATNGLGESWDDLSIWWDCYLAGATCMFLKYKEFID